MYEIYSEGHSLSRVAKAFGVTRQSVYKMFAKRRLPLRPKPDPLPYVEFGGRRYTLRKCGYFGCTNGGRGYLHRHMWVAAKGLIPKGWDIHHRNGDRQDNRMSNLALIEKGEHTKLHARERRKQSQSR